MPESKPIAALGGKTWDELELARHENGRIMFPGEIRRRATTGAVEVVTQVRICVPTPRDEIEARVRARVWMGELKHLDPDRDKDLFAEMEQLCLLARAIRTHDAPHGQFCDALELAGYDEASLHDLQERVNTFKTMLDPREGELTEDRFWQVTHEVAKSGTLYPLAGIGSREQRSCIVRMAKEALLSPMGKSSRTSSESSTPAPSH